MIKVVLSLILITSTIFPQSDIFDFHSPENKKKFSDYLFCEGDNIRAAEEYESIRSILNNDTINFKLMLCYSDIGLYRISNLKYNFSSASRWKEDAGKLYIKNLFLAEPY